MNRHRPDGASRDGDGWKLDPLGKATNFFDKSVFRNAPQSLVTAAELTQLGG
jgi:hypothetical protein